MRLSAAQRKVIEAMKAGAELKRVRAHFSTMCFLNGERVASSTVYALSGRKMIAANQVEAAYSTTTYRLTKKGEKAARRGIRTIIKRVESCD